MSLRNEIAGVLQQLAIEIDQLLDKLGQNLDNQSTEEYEGITPESVVDEGDEVRFVCVNKDDEVEILKGTVIETLLHDDIGWFNRVKTDEGRKFRVPIDYEQTRLGTKLIKE